MFTALKKKLGLLRKSEDGEATGPIGEQGKRIREEKLEEICWDLEMALLESDVAEPVAETIIGELRENLRGKKIAKGFDLEDEIEKSLRASVKSILSANTMDFYSTVTAPEKPVVIMFVGINGTGKTTVIAKLASMLKERGNTVVIAAGDTFRAGAIEQLKIHGDALDIRVVSHEHGGDAAAVAFDAVEHARARHRDFVLIDTAGRMQTNSNLMDEMKKIRRVADPRFVVFVGDSLAGNDMVEQAKSFDQAVGIDMVVLTKIDADAKGGSALSIAKTVGKPIVFLGTGQKYGDLVPFDPDWMAQRLISAA